MSRIEGLLESARKATGLEDFGEDSFREGLDVLVSSADRQARHNEAGRAAFDGLVVDLLSWRLRIEDCYAQHPEIDEQEIVAPLFGLGLPRTGSTALSCLLAEDPAIRYLRTWEAQAPCPPPDLAIEADDPRIAAAAERIAFTDRIFPRMKAMLPMGATAPMECQSFMGYDFKSQLFLATNRLPDYKDWLLDEADLVPTFRYLKRVLKLLQWRRPPGRWRLKNPSHTAFIAALDTVFPDARFWMTHRDIGSVIPSVVDLYIEMSGPFTDTLDREGIIAGNLDWWDKGLHRLLAFREAGNDHRFVDVRFQDFRADAMGEVERVYGFLGEELSETARARMLAWQQETPADQHGGHRYDPAELGIDVAAVRARFAYYAQAFSL